METFLETVETSHKPKQRRISVTLHFIPGQDDDLIRVLAAIPNGQRSTVLKKALRGKKHIAHEQPQPAAELQDIQARIEWMQQAITDLPGFVERLVNRVASMPTQPEITAETVDEATLKERAGKLKARKW